MDQSRNGSKGTRGRSAVGGEAVPGQPLSLASFGLQPHVSTFLTLFMQERLGEEARRSSAGSS